MKEGAEILVRTCANVRSAEEVVIVTDPERMTIAEALAEEAREVGAVASILIPPERSIDNEEPGPAVAVAISAADVVFLPVTLAMAHTRAVREAIGAGARVLSMTAFTERMMREGGLFTDFRARQPLCLALAARLTAGERLRVTNPAGTDLTMRLIGVTGTATPACWMAPASRRSLTSKPTARPLKAPPRAYSSATGASPTTAWARSVNP